MYFFSFLDKTTISLKENMLHYNMKKSVNKHIYST